MASVLSARPLGINAVRTVARSSTAKPARAASFVVKAERELWYPGATAPEYLDGSMAGDFGFDPLRLGSNPETLPYLQEAELMNARWAMMAVTGIAYTDLVGLPKFWEAGSVDYGIDFTTLVAIQIPVMGLLEAMRIRGFYEKGESGLGFNFPFDPAGIDSPEMRVKEIKNGRAAMIALVGCVSQYAVTGLSPIEALKAHLANPTSANIYTSAVGNEMLAFVFFLACAPCYLIAQNTISDGEDEEFRPIPW